MSVLVFDSGGMTAFVESAKTRALVAEFLRRGYDCVVPTVILAEIATGTPRDAGLNRVLARMAMEPSGESVARLAGRLRTKVRVGKRSAPSAVDALVAAHAVVTAERAVVLTSDPDDMRVLLAAQPKVSVEAV